jgi:hypothetical protein
MRPPYRRASYRRGRHGRTELHHTGVRLLGVHLHGRISYKRVAYRRPYASLIAEIDCGCNLTAGVDWAHIPSLDKPTIRQAYLAGLSKSRPVDR